MHQNQFDDMRLASENNMVRDFWVNVYRGIGRANTVEGRMDGIAGLDDKLKNQYLGEARFLRAFFYFNLVRLFGDVPLITREYKDAKEAQEAFGTGRTPVDQVYAKIIEDVTFAEQNLPDLRVRM